MTNVHPEVQKNLFNGMTTGEARQKAAQAMRDVLDGKIDATQAKEIMSELKKHNAALKCKLAEMRRELAKRNIAKQTETK